MDSDTVARIGVYAMVLTDTQETENQAMQLREFARRHGWQIVCEYRDYETGSKSDRPEFQRMLEDASKRKFDLVLFWSLDRLSREGAYETRRSRFERRELTDYATSRELRRFEDGLFSS